MKELFVKSVNFHLDKMYHCIAVLKSSKDFKVTFLIRTHFQFCPYVSHCSMIIWSLDVTQLDLAK